MCRKVLKRLFSRSKKETTPEQTTPERNPHWTGKVPSKYFLRNSSRGGLNMPRYQPCPKCRGGAKRRFKTDFGASYLCRCGRSFAVSR